MDVETRVAGYEVTTAPARTRLRLVWVRRPDTDARLDGLGDGADAGAGAGDGSGGGSGSLAVLDAYRITWVPESRRRAAS